jgi:hypothetical protein
MTRNKNQLEKMKSIKREIGKDGPEEFKKKLEAAEKYLKTELAGLGLSEKKNKEVCEELRNATEMLNDLRIPNLTPDMKDPVNPMETAESLRDREESIINPGEKAA